MLNRMQHIVVKVIPPLLGLVLMGLAPACLAISLYAGPLWDAHSHVNTGSSGTKTKSADIAAAMNGAPAGATTHGAAALSNTNRNDLIAKAQSRGRIAVILKLDVDFRAEGSRSGPEIATQRNSITNRGNAVTQSLAGMNAVNIKRYHTVPYLAATLSANALQAVGKNAMVIEIIEDVPIPPTLAESTSVIGADNAWQSGYDGSGWTVAVLDTGVDKNHNFLSGKIVSEACYSTTNTADSSTSLCPGGVSVSTSQDSGLNCPSSISGCDHGTHVAGIVAGSDYTSNGPGYNGVANGANIIAIQVSSQFTGTSCTDNNRPSPCALSYTSDQMLALDRVHTLSTTYNIAAVNMSLGEGKYTSNCDGDARKANIDNLRSIGIATVIATGNDGYTNAINSPACISSAISVGSTCDSPAAGAGCTAVDHIASYSNIASFISLLAPGSHIFSSIPGTDAFDGKDGTSMAAPHVAGAWALMRQLRPAASVSTILGVLQNTGTLVNDQRPSGSVTWMERINIDGALTAPLWTNVASTFSETWDTSTIGTYIPTSHDIWPLPFLSGDEGEWLLGDTVSEFPDCAPSSPHLAEIFDEGNGDLALRLTSNDSNSSCADNIWIDLEDIPQLGIDTNLPVTLNASTALYFEEVGSLINPQTGSPNCLLPPCGDTISLLLMDNNGNVLAYVLQHAPNAVPNITRTNYREIFLDTPSPYARNLFDDFSTIPDFIPDGAQIEYINFLIDEHGQAAIDNIMIGGCTLLHDTDGNGNPDNDGDGLCDDWEINGIDYDGDGLTDLQLYDVNKDGIIDSTEQADPNHKDVYVEIDWMLGHQPNNSAMQQVISAFASAPVDSQGIRLHIQNDEQAIDHHDNITAFGTTKCSSPVSAAGIPDFDAIKQTHFGTASERLSDPFGAHIIPAKAQVFRYALSVHNLLGMGNQTGCAELPGNDFVVSLGSWAPDATYPYHPVGNTDQQASTFMHEMGHTFGLGHGGSDDVNCKPNYLSVMSYSRQFDGTTISGRRLDYSHSELNPLDENNLNEFAGIGGAVSWQTSYGPITHDYNNDGIDEAATDSASGPIDWNQDGDGGAELNVSADINDLGIFDCNGGAKTVLKGYDDWANLLYNFRNTADYADGFHSTANRVQEITLDDVLAMSPDTDHDGVRDLIDNCMQIANSSQANNDGDTLGDACDTDNDNDGLADNVEVAMGTDPLKSDTDGDGLVDGTDGQVPITLLPTGIDTNDDGFVDGEQTHGTNPTLKDTDGDQLNDGIEVANGADPQDPNDWPYLADGDLAPYGNPDGNINAADVLIAMRIALGNLSPVALQYAHGDMNKDGSINVSDLLVITKLALN